MTKATTVANASVPRFVFIIPALMSLIALAHLPYGYYQILRLVVTACAGWVIYDCAKRERWAWLVPFGLIALTFNPVFRVHLDREIWSVLNVITAAAFLFGTWIFRGLRT